MLQSLCRRTGAESSGPLMGRIAANLVDEPASTPEAESMGPIARMMMSVAAHAITSYVQFRALAEVLIAKGVLSREELEQQFASMREQRLEQTIDEWFTPDIAYHIKMAVESAMAQDAAGSRVAPPEPDEVARARAMQSGGPGPGSQ